MSSALITPFPPRTLTADEFIAYANAWKTLVKSPEPGPLRSCFATEGGLINYVYLPAELAAELLAGNPAAIALAFAVVPGTTSTFSMILAGLDADNQPRPPYYLAGVAGRATVTIPPAIIDEPIPYPEAARWIEGWNALLVGGLSAAQFDSGSAEQLYGYIYSVADFREALASGTPPRPALWLNFALHDATPLFGTVLTLNSVPDGRGAGTIVLSSKLRYEDVASPCPPNHFTFPNPNSAALPNGQPA